MVMAARLKAPHLDLLWTSPLGALATETKMQIKRSTMKSITLAISIIGFSLTSFSMDLCAVHSVSCTGTSASGTNYTVVICAMTTTGSSTTLNAIVSKDRQALFSGTMILFQQVLVVDPVSGQKFELNKFWNPPANTVQISIKENDLLSTTALILPEPVKLNCSKAP